MPDPGELNPITPVADDPYLAWQRALQQQPAAPDAVPAPMVQPGPAIEGPDPYTSWAGPVTSPDGSLSNEGPVTSPREAPTGAGPSAPQGPVMQPGESPSTGPNRNVYGTPDAFQGRVDPQQRAQAIADMTPEQQAAAIDSMTPEEKLRVETLRQRSMVMRQAELEHQAALENMKRAQENLAMQQASAAKADADTREVMARANQLATQKFDPNPYGKQLGIGGTIATLLSTAIGGAMSEFTGGRNLALEQFNKQVENYIASQHADMANQWRGVDLKRNAIAAEYERHGDLYKAQETYRQAHYVAAINDMQSQLQQFDPAGGTALAVRNQIDQFRGAQQQSAMAFAQQQQKNTLDAMKEDREQRLAAANIEHLQAEAAKLRSAGTGVPGTAINPGYSVPTGFLNPFDPGQQIMAKRQIGGKGEDPKERNGAAVEIEAYSHVQDYLKVLNQIAAHKSMGEAVWKGFRDTDAEAYDSAKLALTSYMTKAIGDRPTAGQLELQEHRIPDRKTVFASSDINKLLSTLAESADRDFSRAMNLVSIDPVPVIKSAQERRKAVIPSAEQALSDAQSAVAQNPSDKNAQAALAAANEQVRGEVAKSRTTKANIAAAAALRPPQPLAVAPPNPDFRTDEYATSAKEANLAIDRYGALLRKFHDEAGSGRADEGKLGQLATEVLHARDTAESTAHELANEAHLRETYERSARAGTMVGAGRGEEVLRRLQEHPGVDPTIDVSRAPQPTPAIVPAIDALLPPGSSYAPPHHGKAKR